MCRALSFFCCCCCFKSKYEKLESVGLHGIKVKMYVLSVCRVCMRVFRHFATSKWCEYYKERWFYTHILSNNFEYLYHFIIFILWQSIQSFCLLNLDYNYGKYAFCIIPYSWNDFDIIIFCFVLFRLIWIYLWTTGCVVFELF